MAIVARNCVDVIILFQIHCFNQFIRDATHIRAFNDSNGNTGQYRSTGSVPREDLEMGHCLRLVGVAPVDLRDSLGRHQFLPLRIEVLLVERGSIRNTPGSTRAARGAESSWRWEAMKHVEISVFSTAANAAR